MYSDYLEAAKPELEKYNELTKQIKATINVRKELQAEKKTTPVFNVLKHRELSSRIEDLTEQLEDLRSERAIILRYLGCEGTQDTAQVKNNCAKAEAMLNKIEVGEAKYSYALDDAKIAFAELQEQAREFDAGELYEARLTIRPAKEQDAVQRLQRAYGEKYDANILLFFENDIERFEDKEISIQRKIENEGISQEENHKKFQANQRTDFVR